MGGLGSGGQRRAHRWVGSCAELNVHPLLARGCLEPGRSSTWTFSGVGAGDAPAAISISLRCDEAGRLLHLSWHDGELGDVTETVPIVHAPCNFGGTRPYFICGNGTPTADAGTTDAGSADAGEANAGVADAGTAVGCGRRAAKLYLVHRRLFLCRHCSGLVYVSPYQKRPWQRAYRQVDKLARRLARADAPPLAKSHRAMPDGIYAQLLEELLRAELSAYEAGTADLQELIARLEEKHSRHRRHRKSPPPQFTLE